jgi:glycosyltransferase involved in cell wall biosynthesis
VALVVLVPLALPLLAIQALRRRWGPRLGITLAGVSEPLMGNLALRLQPFRYLNDFGLQGLPILVGLRPDVIHSHDLVTLSTGARGRELLECRLIYDAHELETHTNYHSLTPATKRWIARYEQILIAETDRVITVCESIADWLMREYKIERPLVVMNAPASPPLEGADGRSDGVRSHLGLADGVPLVVYVGSVTIDRGLELCVRALHHLPGVHLATVGPRYTVTEAAMLEAAEAIGVSDRLHFVDARPADEVVRFIAGADCSVMAIQNICLSYYYCFPNKLLESVFANLPVVVADLYELRRFVEEYPVGVVVDESSAASIADGIGRVLNDDRFRPRPDTLKGISDRFGWPRQEHRLVGLYEELCPAALGVA